MEPKIREVYRCSECDKAFETQKEAAFHCVEFPSKEYECLSCNFVWATIDEAIRCYDNESAMAQLKAAR